MASVPKPFVCIPFLGRISRVCLQHPAPSFVQAVMHNYQLGSRAEKETEDLPLHLRAGLVVKPPN